MINGGQEGKTEIFAPDLQRGPTSTPISRHAIVVYVVDNFAALRLRMLRSRREFNGRHRSEHGVPHTVCWLVFEEFSKLLH